MRRNTPKRPLSEAATPRPGGLILLCLLPLLPAACGGPVRQGAHSLSVAEIHGLPPFDPAVQSAALAPGIPSPPLKNIPEYRIDLEIASDLASYTGSESIALPNTTGEALTAVGILLLPELTGGELRVLSLNRGQTPLDFSVQGGLCTVNLGTPLPPGQTMVLKVSFAGSVPSSLRSPGIFLYREGYLSLGGFYPALVPLQPEGSRASGRPAVRHGDPPAVMLANYLVRFSAPAGMRFAVTGLLVKEKREENRETYLAVSGPAREFYLCGADDWQCLRIRRQGVRINSYYPEGSRLPGINAAYYAADALRIFARRFGPYPYTELDVVSAPLGSHGLGMEYPGIIVLNDDLYDPEGRLGFYGADFIQEGTTAHEVAHQWFYNLVGSDPVLEPWLDEAFAQYATWFYFRTIRGEWGGNPFYTIMENRWARIRRQPLPIGLPAPAYNSRDYSAIIYGRAPLFLFELIRTGGRETFDTLLTEYIDRYRWRQADSEGFRRLLSVYYPLQGEALFRKWVLPEE
jgi:hypothetical protein